LGGDPAGGNLISVCFFFYGRCDALGDARRDARDALGDACFSERERALAVVLGLASPITPHPLGGCRDRLGELGGGRPLALGPFRHPFARDHPEADKGAPDPLDLVDGQVQAGGDDPQVYLGERAAVFFAVASCLK